MSASQKRSLTGIVSVLLVVGVLVTIKWTATPRPTKADPLSDHVVTSMVFVLDSSYAMRPVIGTDYFELARKGILEFLDLPGFPTNGEYEVGVIQYARPNSPGYDEGWLDENGNAITGTYHWFKPIRVVSSETLQGVRDLVAGLKRTEHFTGGLLEGGVEFATRLLTTGSDPYNYAGEGDDNTTQYHIFLLTTGEYRLSEPCPPKCYGFPGSDDPNCDWDAKWGYECEDAHPYDLFRCGSGSPYCNRSCQVRYYAQLARTARNGRLMLSALHLGPNWRNINPVCTQIDAEEEMPYDVGQNGSCGWKNPNTDVTEPTQPDRTGFLKEITNTDNCFTTPTQAVGKYARIAPDFTFLTSDPDDKPGDALDIARTLSKWLCEWETELNTPAQLDILNADGDCFGTDIYPCNSTNTNNYEIYHPILPICDNCPDMANPRQRDCNGDGRGDLCQQYDADCGVEPPARADDSDHDGLCDLLDTCDGGDDCLVRYWAAKQESTCLHADSPDLSTCGCDCDKDSVPDLCQAAIEYGPYDELYIGSPEYDADVDGVADCVQAEPPTCEPIPTECNYANVLPQVQDFSDYAPLSRPVADWFVDDLWYVSHSDAALSFLNEDDTNDPNAYINAEYRSDSSVLKIDPASIDSNNATWYLSSPLYEFPDPTCTLTENAPGTGSLLYCLDLGPYSYMAVDLDLKVDTRNSQGQWDLEVLAPCDDTDTASSRAKLRFQEDGNDSDELGEVLLFDPGTQSWQYKAQFRHGVWFNWRIYLNNTDPYWVNTQDECAYRVRGGDAIRLWKLDLRVGQTTDERDGADQGVDTNQLLTVGPDAIPGLQFRFGSSDTGRLPVAPAYIGRVHIEAVSGCEWDSPSNDRGPCSGSCVCDNVNAVGKWACN